MNSHKKLQGGHFETFGDHNLRRDMASAPTTTVEVLGQRRHLRDFVEQLRSWLYEVEQLGIPKFGETGYRLRSLKPSLREYFDCCRRRRGEGLNHDFEEQSHKILDRLDTLIGRLEMPDPPFESWQELEQEIADFSDDLESLETKFVNCTCD